MTKEEIEYYHNSGLMPDWIYYQVNGKTAEENYRDILMKRNKDSFRESHTEIYLDKYKVKQIIK